VMLRVELDALGRRGEREAEADDEGGGKEMVRKTVNECLCFKMIAEAPKFSLFPYTTLFRSDGSNKLNRSRKECDRKSGSAGMPRSEERFSRNAETDLVCCLLLEKKKASSQKPTRCRAGSSASTRTHSTAACSTSRSTSSFAT